MTQRFTQVLGIAGLLSALCGAGCSRDDTQPPPPAADLVLQNGGVYTVDADRRWAEALAVRDGVIVVVGSNAEVAPLIGAGTRVVDLSGRMALPGFHDAHIHPTDGGHELLGCSLVDLPDAAAIMAKIAQCAAQTDGQWLVVDNWNLGLFPQGKGHRRELDAIVPDRPVLVRGSDGHNAWVNSRALKLAGIDATTPDPPLGVIDRDAASGEPTGMLREAATGLVEALIPRPTPQANKEALAAALAELARVGVTSLIDASVSQDILAAYRALDAEGGLSARVQASLTYRVFARDPPEVFDRLLAERASFHSARLDVGSVKLFLDGVLEGETAALVEPYEGLGDQRGTLNFPPDELPDIVARFDAAGLQVHMHAIGDLAVREGLDAIEEARRRNGPGDQRHHIAHLQLVHPEDVPRFAALGVSANFQALWAYPDEWIMNINLPVVGRARVERMYPIGSIHRAGGRLVGGSDWSVSSMNPLDAIETAVTRSDSSGRITEVLNASERVDLATMIDAYTINGAWLMHHEAEVGSLEPGKRADLIVLDRNLFAVPETDISEATVLLTLLDGAVIFDSDDPATSAAAQ